MKFDYVDVVMLRIGGLEVDSMFLVKCDVNEIIRKKGIIMWLGLKEVEELL